MGAVCASVLAMFARGASKILGLDVVATMRPFAIWWPQAILTYTLCGAVAGLIGALCFFHLRKQRQES
jgi:H+/Cl- antiporter ClcA